MPFKHMTDRRQIEALRDPAVVQKYGGDIKDGLYEWETTFLNSSGFFGSPGKRLLSLGCGGGREALPLAQMGFDVTAIDACAALIAKAREAAQSGKVRVNFLTATVPPLSAELGAFSHIMATYNFLSYIYELEEMKRLLRQVKERMARNGKFFFTFHDRTSRARSLDGCGIVKEVPQLPGVNCATIKARFFRRDELFPLIEGAGLRVVDSRRIGELVRDASRPVKWGTSTVLCLASHQQ